MISERGYWTSKEETDTHEFDQFLCSALIKLTNGMESITDIGCGNGTYVKAFLAEGIPAIGYDGNPMTPELTNSLCHVVDFSMPVDLDPSEFVLCLEVGEHIPVEFEQIFLDNIARVSSKYVLLSWAVEGQYGIGHVNCRNNYYIIRQMFNRGFRHSKIISASLRKKSTLPWFKNTLMFFAR
jgi:SAM-dependent methyltransferase